MLGGVGNWDRVFGEVRALGGGWGVGGFWASCMGGKLSFEASLEWTRGGLELGLVCWFGLMGASCTGWGKGMTRREKSNVARYFLGGTRVVTPSLISFYLADNFTARIGRLKSA